MEEASESQSILARPSRDLPGVSSSSSSSAAAAAVSSDLDLQIEASQKELGRLETAVNNLDESPELLNLISVEYNKLRLLEARKEREKESIAKLAREDENKKREEHYTESLRAFREQQERERAGDEAEIAHSKSLVKKMQDANGKTDPTAAVLANFQGNCNINI